MSFNSWLRNLRSSFTPSRMEHKHRRRRSLRAAAHRPRLEVLEDRFAPANLLHSLFPDPSGPQLDAYFGAAVAADTNFHVVGAPRSDVGGITAVGQAFVYSAMTGVLLATLNNPTPASGDFFGGSVAVSGNTVVVGAYGDDTGATDAGSAYVFNATTGALVATLTNPTPAYGDGFGYSLAVSGNTVVVGVELYNTGANDFGWAYVFNANTGALVATLNNPTPVGDDRFGFSVAVSGNTVVVGAYRDDTTALNSGSAYVFNATTGALVATLNNPTPAIIDFFGWSVAVSGNTIVVGAYLDDTEAFDDGSAYVFNATSGALVSTLNNPTPASEDRFGYSVAVSGNTAVVGAWSDDTGAPNAGSAYVFNATTGALVATLNSPTPQMNDFFGVSVALSGNTVVIGAAGTAGTDSPVGSAYEFNATTGSLLATLDNPTTPTRDYFGGSGAVSGNTVVVGAAPSATGPFDAGSASVFNATTGALIATLNSPSPTLYGSFGNSVAVSGNTVVIGDYGDYTGGYLSGSAHVFDATTGALVATLHNPTPADYDYFGYSVAVSGNTVVVGALGEDAGAFTGSAYVFNATTGALVATLNSPTPAEGDRFGFSVAVSGNIVVVGVPYDNATDAAGTAYVFNATTGALVATLNNPTPTDYDNFGASVAVSGSTVAVGAWGGDTGATDSGSAYVFNGTTGALVATLNNPTPAIGDEFGLSVAVSGNTVVVGVPFEDTTDAGSAYVFNATTGALIDTLNNPTPTNGNEFGLSVAVSGATVVVGAPFDDTQNTDQGAAYVYSLAAPTVQAVQVNDGSVQRSRVSDLTVTFSTQVSFAGAVGNAFTLVRNGGGAVNFSATANVINGVTVVTLNSFTGSETQFGSLKDGRYTLTAIASQISAGGFILDGDGDGLPGGNLTFGDAQGLFRFFGDINGDRHVDIADFGLFSSTFNLHAGQTGFTAAFDFNGDGVIDIADFGQFSIRMFTVLP